MKRADSIKHPFRYIAVAVIVIGMIGLCIWDIADPPLFWQKEAQQNQKVILEYAKEHYPNAKIIEEKYESNKFNWSANPLDQIVFEQDGVQFAIWANDGEFGGDNFLSAKASQYIKREIIEPFIIPRNITAKYGVYFSGKAPEGPVVEYDEGIRIHLNVISDYQKDTPEKSGWLYDFYIYFQSESNLKDYQVSIQYRVNDDSYYLLRFREDSTFASYEEFYNAFQRIGD